MPVDITSLTEIIQIDLLTIFYIIYLIALAFISVKLISLLIKKIGDKAGYKRIAANMIIPLVKLIIYFTVFYMIITSLIQPSLEQLILFSGFFGAALGFGLKDLLADIVGGIVIAFERPFLIGDKITIDNKYGEVTDIGLRSTRIITPDDSVVSIPNFLIFNQSASSANSGKTEMLTTIDLFINNNSNILLAEKILQECLVISRFIYISKSNPYTVLVDDFPYYRRLRAKAYVNDLRYEFEFKSEVTKKTWQEFNKNGIYPPHIPKYINSEQTAPN